MRWIEERASRRVPLMVPVYFDHKFFERVGEEIAGFKEEVLAWTQNISTGGLSLYTKIPLYLRETMKLQFEIPNCFEPIGALAQVVWHFKKDYQNETYHCVGLKFISMEEQHEWLLGNYVQKYLPEG
jgi:hypothetical protein